MEGDLSTTTSSRASKSTERGGKVLCARWSSDQPVRLVGVAVPLPNAVDDLREEGDDLDESPRDPCTEANGLLLLRITDGSGACGWLAK